VFRFLREISGCLLISTLLIPKERNNQTIEAVEGLCARAIQSKFLEHDIEALISFTIGRADFHRRRLDAYSKWKYHLSDQTNYIRICVIILFFYEFVVVAGGNENAEQVKSLIDMVANVLHHGIDTTKKGGISCFNCALQLKLNFDFTVCCSACQNR
jgi:hypothetical protein